MTHWFSDFDTGSWDLQCFNFLLEASHMQPSISRLDSVLTIDAVLPALCCGWVTPGPLGEKRSAARKLFTTPPTPNAQRGRECFPLPKTVNPSSMHTHTQTHTLIHTLMWPIALYLRMSEDIFELNRWILISSEAFQPQRKGWNEPVTLCNLTICVQEEESIPFLAKAFEVICITCISLLAPLSPLKCHVYIDLLIELFMSGKGSMAACSFFFKMGHGAPGQQLQQQLNVRSDTTQFPISPSEWCCYETDITGETEQVVNVIYSLSTITIKAITWINSLLETINKLVFFTFAERTKKMTRLLQTDWLNLNLINGLSSR